MRRTASALLRSGALTCLAGLPGCVGSKAASGLECSATVAERIQTVIEVEWTPPASGTSVVVFDDGETAPLTTPETTGDSVRLPLLGMPENTDVHWTGTTLFDDGTSATCSGVTRTGSAPGGFPEVVPAVDEPGQDATPWLIGAFYAGAGSRTANLQIGIYRRDGTLVWYYDGAGSTSGFDVHYSRQGGIWFNEFHGAMGSTDITLHRISLEGATIDLRETPYAHHGFTELPDGTIAYDIVDSRLFTDPTTGEESTWVGDGIVEMRTDGRSEQVFSTWDALDPRANERSDQGSLYDGVDWTHGNMVSYDADTDLYLLSLAHTGNLLQVNRTSRSLTTIYGGDGIPAAPALDFQHFPTWLDDGNLLMFNGDETGSGAMEYAVTADGLVEVWRSPMDTLPVLAAQAIRLSNGNTFVNRDAGSVLAEYAPDGTVVWSWRTDGRVFGQFYPIADLYTGGL
jgi:hypothetical protein